MDSQESQELIFIDSLKSILKHFPPPPSPTYRLDN